MDKEATGSSSRIGEASNQMVYLAFHNLSCVSRSVGLLIVT